MWVNNTKIVAAFRGMQVSPAKHHYASVTDGQTDRRTDRQTTDKVIPMCRYASQATQKLHIMYKEMSIYVFLSPLIKKSNLVFALYTCLFLYPETKPKSYFL